MQSGVLLPLVLAFIMCSLGLGLSVNDFRNILRQPKALIVGVLCHFILPPLVAFGLAFANGMRRFTGEQAQANPI